jgi:hypothetical protein
MVEETLISLPITLQDEPIALLLNPLQEGEAHDEIELLEVREPFQTSLKPFSQVIKPEQPILFTSSRAETSLQALHVTYGPIPYYPTSHSNGHAYIHFLEEDNRQVKDLIDNVGKTGCEIVQGCA